MTIHVAASGAALPAFPCRRLTPPEAAVAPAPIVLFGRGNVDADSPQPHETDATAVRVPFPSPRSHAEEIANAIHLRDRGLL